LRCHESGAADPGHMGFDLIKSTARTSCPETDIYRYIYASQLRLRAQRQAGEHTEV
jgi:hypothetical protein